MKKRVMILGLILSLFMFSKEIKASGIGFEIRGLSQLETTYEAGTSPETIDFVKGLELYSNTGKLSKEKLLVDYTEVNFNHVGTYQVHYYILYLVNNSKMQVEIESVDITIVDTTSPIISGVRPIFVEQGSTVDYFKGIVVKDNDEESKLDLKVFSNHVDLNTVGTYNIFYYVSDYSNNYTKVDSKVIVLDKVISDTVAPELTLTNASYRIELNGVKPNFIEGVKAMDQSQDITSSIQIDDSGIDYNKIGVYKVYYLVFDKVGNFTKKSADVYIGNDLDKPIFDNLGTSLNITVKSFDKLQKGITASDAVCGDVTRNIEVFHEAFNLDVVGGPYEVTFKVTDCSNNVLEQKVDVYVVDDVAPTFNIPSSVNVRLNQHLALNELVSVIDNYDEHVTFEIVSNNVDTSKVGMYIVTFSATDTAGNSQVKEMIVNVYKINDEKIYENPIVLGTMVGIFVSSLIALVGLASKKRK